MAALSCCTGQITADALMLELCERFAIDESECAPIDFTLRHANSSGYCEGLSFEKYVHDDHTGHGTAYFRRTRQIYHRRLLHARNTSGQITRKYSAGCAISLTYLFLAPHQNNNAN